MRTIKRKHGPVILLPVWVFVAAHILSAQEGYVGAEVCGACHTEEFAAQSQSNHAIRTPRSFSARASARS